jgi:outer membrane protein assembly factor BamB
MVSSTPITRDGRIFFGSCDNNFYSLDASTGKLLWKFPTNGIIIPKWPIIHGDVMYFGSYDCNVYALNTDGKLLWRFPTSLSFQSPVNVEGGGYQRRFESLWNTQDIEEKKKREEETEIRDYGELSGTYVNVGKTDYLGGSKQGYVKKRDF